MEYKIVNVGELAYFEDFPMLVTFNESAPIGLDEICIMIDYEANSHDFNLSENDKVRFGDQIFTIEKIGHLANHTLSDLGHATFYFEEVNDLQPGAVLLSPNIVPKLEKGDTVEFIYE